MAMVDDERRKYSSSQDGSKSESGAFQSMIIRRDTTRGPTWCPLSGRSSRSCGALLLLLNWPGFKDSLS